MMKIDQEDFNRKAQHILDTVVKPQVEKYEKAKAAGQLKTPPSEDDMDWFYDRLSKAAKVPREYLGKKEEEQ